MFGVTCSKFVKFVLQIFVFLLLLTHEISNFLKVGLFSKQSKAFTVEQLRLCNIMAA